MADHTTIEWTEATWNPVTGCSVTSPGCTNCYAMKLAGTRLRTHASRAGLTRETKAGPVWTGEVRFNEQWLDQPLRWTRPRMIFVCAHGDLFHEDVPDEWIDRVFAVMALAPQHTFQVLTKRSARMREYLTSPDVVRRVCTVARQMRIAAAPDPERWPNKFHRFLAPSAKLTAWAAQGGCAAEEFERREPGRDWPSWVDWPLPNVWLGVSVEDQARADERIPDLLATPAAVRWLSCEPLLGPVDLSEWMVCPNARDGLFMDPTTGAYECCRACDYTGVGLCPDWIVAGGESGTGARPMHPNWARGLRDQCAAAGVPFFFKQWGAWAPGQACIGKIGRFPAADLGREGWMRFDHFQSGDFEGTPPDVILWGKKRAGRLLDGVTHDAMPERV